MGVAGVSRRRFLALSAVGAAGVALLGPERAAAAADHFDLLSVGYVDSSDGLTSLRHAPWPLAEASVRPGTARSAFAEEKVRPINVLPAESLLMGDPELSLGTVRMRVHGLHPALDASTAPLFGAAFLTVLFPPDDPQLGDYLPATPWGVRGGLQATGGLPVEFPVPLRVDGGLELVLDVIGLGGRAKRYATAFTIDPVSGQPKLQRGIYLLGLGAENWGRPRRLARPVATPQDLAVVVSFEPVAVE
jgi:hypothetical protein